MQTNYRVLVMTSDNYLPAIQTFAHLFNKYWGSDTSVVVSGFSEPTFVLPSNFSFFSAGQQDAFPFEKWSDALYITLEQCMVDDVFVLMLEDYWITRRVNTYAVSLCADYARMHDNILKVDLCADRLYALGTNMTYDTYDYLDIIRSNPDSAYHMSLWPGIWRGDNLLKALVPGESPHSLEIDGTARVRITHPELDVVGTRQNPLNITLGLRSRDYSKIDISGLQPDDVEALKRNGYLYHWMK